MEKLPTEESTPCTMLDLVFHLSACNLTVEQIESRALELIRSNRVRLVGTFCGHDQTAI